MNRLVLADTKSTPQRDSTKTYRVETHNHREVEVSILQYFSMKYDISFRQFVARLTCCSSKTSRILLQACCFQFLDIKVIINTPHSHPAQVYHCYAGHIGKTNHLVYAPIICHSR